MRRQLHGLMVLLCWLGALALTPVQAESSLPSFAQVFRDQGVVMLLIDPASGQIVDANPAAEQFYGYPVRVLQGMGIQQINTLTPAQVADERLLAESQGRNYFIFRHRLANQRIHTVEVFSRPFDVDGRKLLLSMVHDITPGRNQTQEIWHYQQRLEEMVDAQVREIEHGKRLQMAGLLTALLVQAGVIVWLVRTIRRRRRLEQERDTLLSTLQSRNQELARLGEVMAHHFQEPARRLVSFAQRLQGKAALADDEDSCQSLAFIDAQARRLSELVRDAQRYLALDHPRHHIGQADTAAVFAAALQASGVTAAGAVVSLPSAWPAVCLPDKTLHELFVILLDNALRYRHPERPLQLVLSVSLRGKRAEFRLADNGTGIAPEYRQQVLGLFTRLVPNSVPGTGMGLALAYKMVSLSGGQLQIDDGLDGGTCILFDLPLEND